MTTIWGFGTPDLMTRTRWVIDISSLTMNLYGPVQHLQSHTLRKKIRKVTKRTNHILDTLDIIYLTSIYTFRLNLSSYMFNASEQICMMMIMRGSSMHEAVHDMNVYLHPAYGAHHRLHIVREKSPAIPEFIWMITSVGPNISVDYPY